jgi:hypothetical protein
MRLRSDGQSTHYEGQNAGGYTLEALFEILPNGRPEPDFAGWEIKAHKVRNLANPGNAFLTLFTSQPTDGFYRDEGPEAFVRKFGYVPEGKRPGKLHVYGDHFMGQRNPKTGLTLHLLQGGRGPYCPSSEHSAQLAA